MSRTGAQPLRAAAGRSRGLAALDWLSLAVAALLTAWLLASVRGLPPLAWAPVLAAAVLLGWALADLGSGFVHFLCDRFGREDTPLLGPAVIRPFREHHRDPRAITTHGFAQLSGNNALALTPLLAAGGQLAPLFGETLLASMAFSSLMSACVGLFTTNQIHRWSHMPNAPRLARWLQRAGLVISAESHAQHHSARHDSAYCVTTGWCNAWLDRQGVWVRAERLLRGRAGPRPPQQPHGGALPRPERA